MTEVILKRRAFGTLNNRVLSDAVALADAVAAGKQRNVIIGPDAISTADIVAITRQMDRSAADSIVAGDSIVTEFTGGGPALTLPNIFGSARTSPGQPELQRSTDGTNWTSTNLVPYPNQVPRNADRNPTTGTILIVGDNGLIIRSTDEGLNWTNQNAGAAAGIPLTFDMTAVWYGNGRWIIAGSSPAGVYTSTDDGQTFSGPIDPDNGTGTGPTGNAPAGFSDLFYDGMWINTLGLHVGVGYKGAIWTSPDGLNWTERVADNNYIGSFYGFRGITYSVSQGLIVIGGDGDECQTSPDAITWTKRTLAAGFTTIWGCGYSPSLDLFIMYGSGASNLPILQTSPDAITWTNRTLPSPNNHSLYSGGWDDVNSKFIVLGRFGRAHNSADGISWTYTPPDNSVGSFVGNTSASIFSFIGGGQPIAS